jgi:hypothetical protein
MGPQPLPLSLFHVLARTILLHHILSPWCHELKTSKTVSQNKPFHFLSWFSSDICYSNGKLTTTMSHYLEHCSVAGTTLREFLVFSHSILMTVLWGGYY